MQKYFLIVILKFWALNLTAQFSAIENETGSILFAGIENKFNVAAENTACSYLVLRTTNGIISGGNCQFIYSINFDSARINFIRDTEIEIYKKTRKNQLRLLQRKVFVIKKVPDPVACILTCNDTQISYLILQNSRLSNGHPKPPDIRAEVPFSHGLPFDCRFVVDSFYFSIFRGDSCIVMPSLNKGNYFASSTYEAFKQLTENDTIVFDKIYAKGCDGSIRLLKSLRIRVSK